MSEILQGVVWAAIAVVLIYAVWHVSYRHPTPKTWWKPGSGGGGGGGEDLLDGEDGYYSDAGRAKYDSMEAELRMMPMVETQLAPPPKTPAPRKTKVVKKRVTKRKKPGSRGTS